MYYIPRLLLLRMHGMQMLFFTLTTMEGHHFAFLENILCYISTGKNLNIQY